MSTITTINASDQITNSRAVINTNFSNLNTDKIETSVLDTDTALTANSDSKIATQKAVKTYADALLGQFTSSKSGVSAGPASSSTQTITHTLGRTPIVIRLTSFGGFASSTNAMSFGASYGTYNATGNRNVHIVSGVGSIASTTSTTFAIKVSYANTSNGTEDNYATGVVQNVTSTSFDIVWTVTGTPTNISFLWEAN